MLLQKEFDEDDIANDKYSSDTSADSSSDSETTNLDNLDSLDDEPPVKQAQKVRKKVKFTTKKVTAASAVDTSVPSTIKVLAKQMQDLQLGQMHQIQELQQGQANIL